jgi:hypothetical protein
VKRCAHQPLSSTHCPFKSCILNSRSTAWQASQYELHSPTCLCGWMHGCALAAAGTCHATPWLCVGMYMLRVWLRSGVGHSTCAVLHAAAWTPGCVAQAPGVLEMSFGVTFGSGPACMHALPLTPSSHCVCHMAAGSAGNVTGTPCAASIRCSSLVPWYNQVLKVQCWVWVAAVLIPRSPAGLHAVCCRSTPPCPRATPPVMITHVRCRAWCYLCQGAHQVCVSMLPGHRAPAWPGVGSGVCSGLR